MSFIFRNIQKSVAFNTLMLENHVAILRKLMGVTSYDLAVVCFEDEEVRRLNSEYRGIDEPTDVLAFPFLDVTTPGDLPDVKDPEERILGDIVLGLPYILRGCVANSQRLEEVLPVMVTHGLCHLMGYDHEEENQWRQMYNKELEILQKFNAETKLNCKPLLGVGH